MRNSVNAVAALVAIGLLVLTAFAWSQQPFNFSTAELAKHTMHRRAVDAVIWGQPTVSFDSMRQAYFRDTRAAYNDIIWRPRISGWKNQSLTVNTSVCYVYFLCN